MNALELVSCLLSQPFIHDFLISIGSGLTWDIVKNAIARRKDEESLEYLSFKIINDTLREFYHEKIFEYDETLVMDAFLEQVKDIHGTITDKISKSIIEKTVGHPLNIDDIVLFGNIFKNICATGAYEPLYRRIMLENNIPALEDIDHDWMQDFMKDNCCSIDFEHAENYMSALQQVKTTLSESTWFEIIGVVYEIVSNAFSHGHATLCKLNIEAKSLSIIDDGHEFNFLSLSSNERSSGGSLAIKDFKKHYPNIKLRYSYNRNNIITLCFDESVFDVNTMSEIFLPAELFEYHLTLKYPEGRFKYYYIDMANLNHNELHPIFLVYSSCLRFMSEFYPLLHNGITEKVFIHFSNVDSPLMARAYDVFKTAISHSPDVIKDALVLIPENETSRLS